ncbi:MAG: AI-2E family transporter [Firmicutes bacterium]|nr:AI-2E family transporter [Bacillota bacterium]
MAWLYREQLFWLGFTLLAIFLLVLVRAILFPFILGVFLTYLTLPAVDVLQRREVPRWIAIIIVYISLGILVWAGTYYLLPVVLEDLNSLLTNLQQQTEKLDGMTRYLYLQLQRLELPETVRGGIDQGIDSLRQFLENLITRVIDLIIQLISKSFYLVLAPILAYYMTRDIEVVKRTIIGVFPRSWRPEVIAVGREINRVLRGFIRGQLLVSLFVGASVTLGLLLLGVRYAVVIGIVAGIFNIIPYFGPVVGAIPALLAASADSPAKILYVLGLFLVVNQFEAAVLAPVILQEQVGLHPLLVIFAVLAGGHLYGIVGTLVAVPLAAIFKVLFFYFQGKLAPVEGRS